MDELELLKKHWQKDGVEDRQLTSKQIYPMLLKKSSSIVKTLFYISIGELAFWILINTFPFFMSDTYRKNVETIYGDSIGLTILSFLSYAVIVLFVFLLYKAYKSISVTDSAKKLIENILKTRKIIKYYVVYNLVIASLSMLSGFYYASKNDPGLVAKLDTLNDTKLLFVSLLFIVFTAIFVLIIWLFYKLIYGILVKRLNRNYKELKKLEV